MFADLTSGISRKIARYHRSKPFAMRNDAPLVSFTFDDVPESAYTNGAAVLEQCGVRGTFYLAAGTCGASDPNWRVIEHDQVRPFVKAATRLAAIHSLTPASTNSAPALSTKSAAAIARSWRHRVQASR
jgi:peptidoglycan/xylan/chitin deacetylase (PgdA/CDA1 family)